MPKDLLDRLVESYLVTGDPSALGSLYEGLLPKLRARAARLCSDPSEAEDLVHEVFLVVLQSRGSFRRGHDFEAWLSGILKNKARKLREKRARKIDPLRLENQYAARSPLGALEDREARRQIRVAMEALPVRYRSVVELTLLHGLKPEEIAVILDRRPGTVRVQLHRGLRRMRRDLPPDVWALLPLWFALPARARPARLTPTLVACGVGAAALMTFAMSPWSRSVTEVLPEDAVIFEASESPVAGIRASDPTNPIDQRLPLDTSRDSTTHGGTLRLQLRFTSGLAAAGIAVALLEDPGADPMLEAVHGISDVSGEVTFDHLTTPRVRIGLDRGQSRIVDLDTESGITQESFTIPEGLTVRGQVLDEAGRAVAGAGIWLSSNARAALTGRIVGHADEEGRFVLRGLERGHLVSAVQADHSPAAPVLVRDAQELQLRLGRRHGSLLGHVVDEAGRPVADAEILVGSDTRTELGSEGLRHPAYPSFDLRSDAKGSFELRGLPTGLLPILIRARDKAPWAGQVLISHGQTAAPLLRLLEGRRLDILCEDSGGHPLDRAQVLVRGEHPYQTAGGSSGPDGQVHLRSLPMGSLRVIVRHPMHRPMARIIAAGTRPGIQRFHMQAMSLLKGRLLDEGGEALESWTLVNECFFTGPGLHSVRSTTTDDEGSFAIPYASKGSFNLRLCPPGSREPIGLRVHPPKDQPLEIRVPDRLWKRGQRSTTPAASKSAETRPAPTARRSHILLALPIGTIDKLGMTASLSLRNSLDKVQGPIQVLLLAGPRPTRLGLRVQGPGPFHAELRLQDGRHFEGVLHLALREDLQKSTTIRFLESRDSH